MVHDRMIACALHNKAPAKNANEVLVIRATGGSRFTQKVDAL